MMKFLYRATLVVAALCLALEVPERAHAANQGEVGISTSATLTWMDPQSLNKRLDDIESLGAKWVRVDFNWPSIQPKNAHDYFWDNYDKVVKATAAHHIKILAVLDYTPAWAQDPACAAKAKSDIEAQKCGPRDPASFGAFAGAVAHHYQGKNVRGFEIWNEPNIIAYWKTVAPDGSITADPLAYARLANAAAWQIRQYTDANIVTGGLSPMFEPTVWRGARQSDFLTQLLPHLEKANFDGVAVHPYSWPVLPDKPAIYNAFYTVDHGGEDFDLHTIMAKAGWGDKQIWATEYGATTTGTKIVAHPTRTDRPDHVSEDAQAKMVSEGITNWSAKPYSGPIFIHSDSDKWLADRRNEGGFGLRRDDGSQKPAYEAFKRATQEVERH